MEGNSHEMPSKRKLSSWLVIAATIVTIALATTLWISAQDDYTLVEVASGFERPVFVTEVNDASGRLFVLEQEGYIRIIEDGQLLEQPFLDLNDLTGVTANERGLLGLAFHPDFAENAYFYVNYTKRTDGNTIIARYQVSADDPNLADPNSAEVLLEIDQPYPNHNGGMIAFGPDGYLYIGMGDGGAGGDPQNRAQDLDELLGKMLRIDVDSASPYGIPADNPYADGSRGRPEIWAWGLRNPWRFSFDSATGDLYIGDVGQNAFEEIDFQPADSTGDENYGWRVFEAGSDYESGSVADPVFPIADYGRDDGCSVTGGYVYRGTQLPDLVGKYLYGDYCTGTIWWLQRNDSGDWEGDVLLDTDISISSFGQDLSGEVYLVDHRGSIYRLAAN